MARNDKNIPSQTSKLIYQQANSQCPFCNESDVALLEIHHIVPRSDGGSNQPSNLILTCRNCHGRIGSGSILTEEVNRKKQELGVVSRQMPSRDGANNISVGGSVFSSVVANQLNIGSNVRPPKITYPYGSIGSDVIRKGYIDYLIGRYYDFKKADASYGSKQQFRHAEIHTTVSRKFKAKTFFIPIERFNELYKYMQFRIDRTIQGKTNRSRGYSNYSSFEQYQCEQDVQKRKA